MTRIAFYPLTLELAPGEADKLNGTVLVPGMPVEAFIQTRSRTPLAYLIQPFTDYFTHAFRES